MRRLADLTWEEAAAARGAVVLVPVGATEAHGPHLPLCTDVLISKELARRVAAALAAAGQAALIAPSLGYAVTEFAAEFSGTVSLRPETARALYADLCLGLQRGGFLRVCLLNSHLEPEHVAALRGALDEVRARGGQAVAFCDHTEKRFARQLTEEYRRGTCHAGRYETSLLLAADPRVVRAELAAGLTRNEPDFLGAMRAGVRSFREAGGPRAYFGDPAQASAAEGEEIYQVLVRMNLQVLQETFGLALIRSGAEAG